MSSVVKLSKKDARSALINHHFRPFTDVSDVFRHLKSIQFDPIAPIGCNHDLVLQSRLPNYKIGDWEYFAYQTRAIYDGWDKQASLIEFSGWTKRKFFNDLFRAQFETKIFKDHAQAVKQILSEIEKRGPLKPKDCEYQKRIEEWKGSWYGPSVAKQVLRALWHSGVLMTANRWKGQHQYDLTERVVPKQFQSEPHIAPEESRVLVMKDRHEAMGLVRPNSPAEIWSYTAMLYTKKQILNELKARNEIVPVDIDGTLYHAGTTFFENLDTTSVPEEVRFIAPLDQLLWDRKMVAQVFDFEYSWEIYTPESKRRWGYYVLPILYGTDLVARVEFYCRQGVLEVRQFHWQDLAESRLEHSPSFSNAFQIAVDRLKHYSGAEEVSIRSHIPASAKKLFSPAREIP